MSAMSSIENETFISVDFSMLDVEPVIYFCWMPEHNAATCHRADRAGQEIVRRNKIKHPVNFQNNSNK